jgi:restriction system protein
MAEITRQRTGKFLRKVLEYLLNEENGLPVKQILERIGQDFELTEYEAGSYPSSPGDHRYEKIIRFSSIGLVKAGWLIKRKGRWYITELGKEAYKKYPDPEKFAQEIDRLYKVWKKSLPKETSIEEMSEETEQEYLAYEEAVENAWNHIENYLNRMNPFEFQDLVADLLTAMGYHVAWVSPPGKDKGIDIIAYNDPLGTSVPRIKVQVKHRTQSTSVDGLRAFLSTLGTDDVGIFVSSGGFTSDAREEARTQERRKITLLDLQMLYDLWVQYYDTLTQDARQRLPLKPVYYLDLQ